MIKFALKLHLNKPGLHSVEKPMIVPFHFLSVPFVTCIIEEREGGGHVPLRDKIFTGSSPE